MNGGAIHYRPALAAPLPAFPPARERGSGRPLCGIVDVEGASSSLDIRRLRDLCVTSNWFVVSLSNHGPAWDTGECRGAPPLCRGRGGVPHSITGRVGGKSYTKVPSAGERTFGVVTNGRGCEVPARAGTMGRNGTRGWGLPADAANSPPPLRHLPLTPTRLHRVPWNPIMSNPRATPDTPNAAAPPMPQKIISPSPRLLLSSPRLRGRARERGGPGTKRFHISVGALVAGSRPWPAKQPRPRNRKYPFQRHYSPVLTNENPIKKLICSLETPVSAPRTGRAGEVPAFAGMTGGARL